MCMLGVFTLAECEGESDSECPIVREGDILG